MPIASPEIYAEMLNRAKAGAFAYPAINVSSSQTLNAALKGFADAGSDGIIQVSTGGASYLSGAKVADMVVGATALAEYAHVVAARYPVNIALHTDHCPKNQLDKYVRPLVKVSQERVARGQGPLFQSHMWDGSAVSLKENLDIARALLSECRKAKIVLEVEDAKLADQVRPLMPRVMDAFQTYLREMRQSDLEGSAGLYRLREELTRRVNVAVAPSKINAVLFKEIVFQ
jgi:fructose-bisphosphate aldolase class II